MWGDVRETVPDHLSYQEVFVQEDQRHVSESVQGGDRKETRSLIVELVLQSLVLEVVAAPGGSGFVLNVDSEE